MSQKKQRALENTIFILGFDQVTRNHAKNIESESLLTEYVEHELPNDAKRRDAHTKENYRTFNERESTEMQKKKYYINAVQKM